MNATTDTFDELLAENEIILVDFWAPWCGPCKVMNPIVEELTADGEVSVLKVNVDEERELQKRYGVMAVPTFLLIKNGEVVDRTVGAQTKTSLAEFISGS